MVLSFYKQIAKIWKNPKENLGEVLKNRLIQWRKENTIVKVSKPTRINRARSVGYKAKQGYVIARVKIGKGGRRRKYYGRRGRKPSKMGLTHFTHGKSLQKISEEKAQRRFMNTNVLGSYLAGEDGQHKWFEIIMVDTSHKNIIKNKSTRWVTFASNKKKSLRTN